MNKVELFTDPYAEHFGDHEDVKQNYMLAIDNDIIDEDENPKELKKRIVQLIDGLNKVILVLDKR
jgi:hypothetical protein